MKAIQVKNDTIEGFLKEHMIDSRQKEEYLSGSFISKFPTEIHVKNSDIFFNSKTVEFEINERTNVTHSEVKNTFKYEVKDYDSISKKLILIEP